jgi:hypothetical protein
LGGGWRERAAEREPEGGRSLGLGGPLPRLLEGMLILWASSGPGLLGDIWWTLASGRLILSSGAIPRRDVFSFAAAGAPWVDPEWLTQALFFGIHSTLGPLYLYLLRVLLVGGILSLLAARVRLRTENPFLLFGALARGPSSPGSIWISGPSSSRFSSSASGCSWRIGSGGANFPPGPSRLPHPSRPSGRTCTGASASCSPSWAA